MQICFYLDFKTSVLKRFLLSFRIRSVFCLDIFLKSTNPSSLYKPIDCLSSLFDNKDSIWMPTSSQISAPSKLPMVTSQQLSVAFFFQSSLLLYNKDFLLFYYTQVFFWNINVLLGKQDCVISYLFRYRWIKFCNIQLDKFTL